MTPEQAQQITEELFARYNLHGWKVWTEDDWHADGNHDVSGVCYHNRKLIVLCMKHLTSDEQVLATIMHEIAHVLARPLSQPGEQSHGWTFHHCLRWVRRDCKSALSHWPQPTADQTR